MMPATTVIKRRILTPAEYEAWSVPPPSLPTQGELFETQIALWVASGFATETDLRPLGEFVPKSGIFIVIPNFSRPNDLVRMMELVVLDNRQGTIAHHVEISAITNLLLVPSGPYVILGVNDGRDTVNATPKDSHTAIVASNASPLTGFEIAAFCAAFPAVLKHHRLWACGSRHKQKCVPLIEMEDATPTFNSYFEERFGRQIGSPWCQERKGLRP